MASRNVHPHVVQRHANVKVGTWPAVPASDRITLLDTQRVGRGSFLAHEAALPFSWGSVLVNMMASDGAF